MPNLRLGILFLASFIAFRCSFAKREALLVRIMRPIKLARHEFTTGIVLS